MGAAAGRRPRNPGTRRRGGFEEVLKNKKNGGFLLTGLTGFVGLTGFFWDREKWKKETVAPKPIPSSLFTKIAAIL
jgi:hypothetical protein